MKYEQPEWTKIPPAEREAWSRKQEEKRKADEESLMRRIADAVSAWRHCDADDWRVCRRSRRCAGRNNPCFVKHKEEFYSVIRKYIIPDLKKRRGQGLYDPGPEVEVIDHANEGNFNSSNHRSENASDAGGERHRQRAPERHPRGGSEDVGAARSCSDRAQQREKTQ